MKKCCKLLVIAGLLMSLNSCIWLAVAGIGAAGGATGAYMVEKKVVNKNIYADLVSSIISVF